MYMSEMLVREHHCDRLRQAREDALARQAAELRRLQHIRQRAERQLRRVRQRAGAVGAIVGPTD